MKQSEALTVIGNAISRCNLCIELSEYRTANNYHHVPGEGAPNADLMFLGEGPGEDEAESGRPFVGKAGKLLDKIITAAGFRRDQVFILNIVKCRPPGNRVPTEEEAKNCRKFLEMQIQIVNPKWIICLGKTAAINLLGYSEKMTVNNLRGQHEYEGRHVICTFHPSFLLRPGNEWAKSELWEDIKPAIAALQKQIPS